MTDKDVREMIENFRKHFTEKQKIREKLVRSNSLENPNSEILISRMEEIEEEQLLFIEALKLLKNEHIRPRDRAILRYRIDGSTYESIGDVFLLSRERVRQILNELYKYIAENIKC